MSRKQADIHQKKWLPKVSCVIIVSFDLIYTWFNLRVWRAVIWTVCFVKSSNQLVQWWWNGKLVCAKALPIRTNAKKNYRLIKGKEWKGLSERTALESLTLWQLPSMLIISCWGCKVFIDCLLNERNEWINDWMSECLFTVLFEALLPLGIYDSQWLWFEG